MEVDLDEYFHKTYKNKLPIKKLDEDDEHAPSMQIVERRREVAEMEEALNDKKQEFQSKMAALRDQSRVLDEKQIQLKEYLMKFERFVRENQSKRVRAEKRAQSEKEMRILIDEEIERLEGELGYFNEQKDLYTKKLDSSSAFLKCLEKIVESTEEFSEISNIISRYNTLVATEMDLLERDTAIQEAIEAEKTNAVESMNEKNNEILHYNNELATMQTQLDSTQSELTRWESKWVRIQNTATEKGLSLGKMKIAVHNLYQIVYKNCRQIEPAAPDDADAQLDDIQTFIQDLLYVTSELKRDEND